LGFVTSLNRPGGNLTGINLQFEETTGKRLQLLRDIAPKVSRVAILWDTTGRSQLEAAEIAARQLGMRFISVEVGVAEALPALIEAAVKDRANALVVAQTPFTFGLRAQVAALALKHSLPSIYVLPANAEAGGLISYGPNDSEYYRQAAVFVDKIFKGAKPGDLPVEQPIKWELVINRKTAKALGLTIPQSLLISATKIIE
jgi:putative ABC transport system substrate-binding protein